MSKAKFTIAQKGELRWVSLLCDAKQQECFDVTCAYPGLEVWHDPYGDWRCHARASEHEAMLIVDECSTPEEAVTSALELLDARGITPNSLPAFTQRALTRAQLIAAGLAKAQGVPK